MKRIRIDEIVEELNVPKEAIVEAFDRLTSKNHLYGVFDATSDEFIQFSPEEKNLISQCVIKEGTVELSALANKFAINPTQMKSILDQFLRKGIILGDYIHENKYFITQEQVKTFEKLNDELLEILRGYNAIKLNDLAKRVGLSSEEVKNVLINLMNSKRLKGVIDNEKGVFYKEIVKIPIAPPTKDEEVSVESLKARKVALSLLLEKLEVRHAKGKIPLEDYLEYFKEYRTKLASVELRLARIGVPIEQEIRCIFCGGLLPGYSTAKYCTKCGERIIQCTVCLLPIVQGDEFVECPHCGSFAHRTHLIEWVKAKGICPYCKNRLTEFDIPA